MRIGGRERRKRGFTLIELLTVVVILGILMGLLVTVLQQAKTRARRYKCAAEVRELARAWQSYHATYDSLPAGATMTASMVDILQGNNPGGLNRLKIKFMDFSSEAITGGYKDPWGHLYRMSLNVGQSTNTWVYTTKVHLSNKKAYPYE